MADPMWQVLLPLFPCTCHTPNVSYKSIYNENTMFFFGGGGGGGAGGGGGGGGGKTVMARRI